MTSIPAWLNEPSLQQLFAAVQNADGEARVVGGAVRDFLIGRPGGDIDLATTLPPERVMTLAATQGWKAIPTGIDHGTVTLVLPERTVEVTTLRRDVTTDGRRAVVAYTDDWQEDAARRDFTINALSMDRTGEVFDYFRGRDDLTARRLQFIGDAARRIEEDGLRILRYFRFLAVLGWSADAAALGAIAVQKSLITTLSGERIQLEMKKLLRAENPREALRQMAESGIAPLVSHADWSFARLEKLLQVERQYEVAAMPFLRLFALIEPDARPEVAAWLVTRWKLSRRCQAAVTYFAAPMDVPDAATVKERVRHDARALVIGRLLLAAADTAEPRPVTVLIPLAQTWQAPDFPVTAKDLLARGMVEGMALGDTLRVLENRWVESDYTLTKEVLLRGLQ